MRFVLLLTVFMAMLGLAFSGCATTGSQKPPEGSIIVEFSVLEIGTENEWKIVRNGKETIETTVLSKETIDGTPSYVWKNATGDMASVYDLETNNWMGRWSYSDNEWTVKARPHMGGKQFPLWAGKSYPANYNFWEKDGWSGYVMTKVKVEGWETITVPAGTFEALKIVQKSQYYSLTNWYVPEISDNVKFKYKSRSRGERSGELTKIKKP